MNMHIDRLRHWFGRALFALAACCAAASAAAPDYPTAIAYQGQLQDQGLPVNGSYRMTFRVWDAVSGGAPLGAPFTLDPVQVADGQFFASLDFGADVFSLGPAWLEVTAAPSGNPGAAVTFAPRQKITPAPLAINADRVDGMDAVELMAATGPRLKRTTFDFVAVPRFGQPPVALASLSATPPSNGIAVLRGRGYCNVYPGSGNSLMVGIGTTAASAFSNPINYGQVGVVNNDAATGSPMRQAGWTAERVYNVNGGQQYVFVLAGTHGSGNVSSDNCVGAFTLEYFSGYLPD